jgi:alkylation response protein AidB-like acyl-CoA dehydrogenase
MRAYAPLAEVLGGGLVPEPLVGAVLACRVLGENAGESVLSGSRIVLAAWQDRQGSLDWRGGAAVSGGKVSGRKVFIPGAAGADAFAVATPGGIAIVERDASGLELTLDPTQDGDRFGTIVMDSAPAEIVPVGDIDRAIDEAVVAQAAYLLGLADAAFAMTMEYLKVRRQFDRPIGSFQALQHRATDMKIQLELTRAAVGFAAGVLDGEADAATSTTAASQAKARATDTAFLVAREAIQMHGAIGFTDEYDVGLYARKAMTLSNLFGSAALHRKRYAQHAPEQEAA